MSSRSDFEVEAGFAALIHECSSMVNDSPVVATRPYAASVEPLPSLLDQVQELTRQGGPEPEAIRTIHHLACSGGTIITRCLASLPNTRVLSEVEPHSAIPLMTGRRFFPTDLIQLLRTGTYDSSAALEAEVFLEGLEVIYAHSRNRGVRLLLRDHAHSTYCVGKDEKPHASLRETLAPRFPLRSAVTVRHPLDTFLSLRESGWLHFNPATLDEFSRRLHRFLSDHEGLPVLKYEQFVDDPEGSIEQLSAWLALPYNPGFINLYQVHNLSGNSGRTGNVIKPRPRRSLPRDIEFDPEQAGNYLSVCDRLGYDPAF